MRSTTISFTVLSLLALAMASPEAATSSEQAKSSVTPKARLLTKIGQMKADITRNKANVGSNVKHIKELKAQNSAILNSKNSTSVAGIAQVGINLNRIKGKTAAMGRENAAAKSGSKNLTSTLEAVKKTNTTMINNKADVGYNVKHIAELNAANTKILTKPLTKTSIAQFLKNTNRIIGKTAAMQRESDAAGVASKQLKTLLSKRTGTNSTTSTTITIESLKAEIKRNTLDIGYNAKHIAELHAENAAILSKPMTDASRATLIKNQTSINGKTAAMERESKKAAALKKALETLRANKKKSSTAATGARKSKNTKATSKKQKVPKVKVVSGVAAAPSASSS